MTDVHVVSHTHWDREWYLTREQFRLRLVDLIDRVLDLLDAGPRFAFFHLDGQTIVLEDYLEVRPDQEDRLRRQIGAGRLLVGPWYVMPDMFLVSGEALVRNLALGHRIARRFGGVMPVGYMPDPFGHVAQMPQILSQLGLASAVLWRGFGGERAEYWWEAPDGSRVLLLHLPHEGYGNGVRLPLLPPDEMKARAAALIARERERSAFGQVLIMVGTDHLEPHPALPDLAARLGACISTLPAYVEAVQTAARAPGAPLLETVRGELRGGEDYAFLLPGVLSTRTYLKQANARAQTLLERWAEPLALFACLAGEPYPSGILDYAWKTLLQNHPHDSICGCSVDAVHEENMGRYARATQAAEGVAERALAALARRVPAAPLGALRCVAVNTDTGAYSGVVTGFVDILLESVEPGRAVDPALLEAPAAFFPKGASVAAVTDAGGRGLSFQTLGVEDRVVQLMSRFEPPWAVRARRVHLAWWAEVPACGFAAFDVHLAESAAAPPLLAPAVSAAERRLENELLRIDVNGDGTLEVLDRRSGIVFHRCAALEDSGDVGDEYNYSPPARDGRITSIDARSVTVSPVAAGPLRASLQVDLELPLPASAAEDRQGRSRERVALPVSLEVALDAGSTRVSFTVTVDNRARDHRLRVLFPTEARQVETARADTAFGVVSRPARRPEPPSPAREAPVSTAPLQSFVDAGNDRSGVTVVSEGLMEYEVVEGGGEARVALTLLRCVGQLSRDDFATRRAHAGPAIATPGAQCPGRHEFRFALLPRAAAPSEGELFAEARSFLAPPRVAAPAGGDGRLPASLSFLRIAAEGGTAVLSAAKKADDAKAVILRLFNPGTGTVRLGIEMSRPLTQAFRTDLREQRQQDLEIANGRACLVLPPHHVQTIALAPGGVI